MNKIDKAAAQLTDANIQLPLLYNQYNNANVALRDIKARIAYWERSKERAIETLKSL